MNGVRLAGHCVLVLEDEPLISMDIADQLREVGANISVARTGLEAVKLLSSTDFSAAVLDVQLGPDEDCSAVCVALLERHVPFMFYTAYTSSRVFDDWPSAPVVAKPGLMRAIVTTIAHMIEQARIAA